MNPAKVGRPGKNQRVCYTCKRPCLPKNGDWFFLPKNTESQVFLCKDCEREAGGYQRTMPIR